MREINNIIVHHSASKWGTAFEIDRWHKAPPRNWKGIGYHFVILNGYISYASIAQDRPWQPIIGSIETGRRLSVTGAHSLGYNRNSIGICLIHDTGQKYHDKMLKSLFYLCKFLIKNYKEIEIENILGHYEVSDIKPECPGINMHWFRKKLRSKYWSWVDFLYEFKL